MKILLVVTKAIVAGAQTSVLNLAREMKARGHEVEVAFGDGDWLPVELEKLNIPFSRFKWLKRTHNPLAMFNFILEVKKFLRDKKFEVVHFNSSNTLPGALGVKLASRKIRTVFTFRGMSMLDEHYQSTFWLKLAYKYYFKFFLFFIDEPVYIVQENFDKFGRGQLTKKSRLIYNGLDPAYVNFVSRDEAISFFSKKSGVNLNGKYLIGALGRLDEVKNYEFLIKAFPKILQIRPDAVAVIMGEGDQRLKYEALIKELNLTDKVFLIGNVVNGSCYLKGLDLIVQCSHYEGLSITLIEALFSGILIMTSDVGGNREVLGGCDAEIYQLDNEGEFLNKFKDLQEVNIWPAIFASNQKQAAKFQLKNTGDGYEKAYLGE